MTGTSPAESGFGAITVPTPAHTRHCVLRAAELTEVAISRWNSALAQAHNTFTTYCALLLIHASGHRWVTDPFAWPSSISLSGGFATIYDKVATAAHANRMLWLSELAIRQYELYLKHVEAFGRRLLQMGPEQQTLGAALIGLLEDVHARTTHRMPLFFLVDDSLTQSQTLSHESVDQIFPWWNLPPSSARFLLATELPDAGAMGWKIDLSLTHLTNLSHPLGIGSAIAPSTVGDRLRPLIEEQLVSQGWRLINGLRSQRIPKAPQRRRRQRVACHAEAVWGETRRRAERERNATTDESFVDEFFTRHFPDGDPKAIPREQCTALRDELFDESAAVPKQANHRVLLLIERLIRLRDAGHAVEIPSKIKALEIESTPFADGFAYHYDKAREVREGFLRHLLQRVCEKGLPASERVAMIVASAVVHSALLNKKVARLLPTTIPTHCYPDGNRVLFECPEILPTNWIFDPLTALLIHHHLASGGGAESIRDTDVDSALRRIADSAGIPVSRNTPAVESFIAAVQPYWQYHLPGHLYAVARGKSSTTNFPRTVLARLRFGRPLAQAEEAPDEEREQLLTWPQPSSTAKDATGATFERMLRKVIREIRSGEPIKGKQRSRNLRIRLAKEIETLLEGEDRYPDSVIVVALWLIHLCRRGTAYEANLSFDGTVIPYYVTVRGALLPVLGDRKVVDLDEDEFVDVYAKAVATRNTESGKEELLRLLREFHRFLLAEFAVDLIDWSMLGWHPTREDPQIADANLVSEAEYFFALNSLVAGGNAGERDRMHAGLLILGYRFGIRIGEALRVESRDLHLLDGGEAILEIRPNVRGDLKTAAARRSVPSLEPLTEFEQRILIQLLNARPADGKDPAIGLFSPVGSPRTTISRADASLRIHRALREATGDSSTRYHHLRHGYGNRSYLAVTLGERNEQQSEWLAGALKTRSEARLFLTGQEALFPESVQVIEDLVGHESVTTGFESYVHSLGWALAWHAEAHLPPRLPDRVMATLLGQRRETILRRRKAHAGEAHDLPAAKWTNFLPAGFGIDLGPERSSTSSQDWQPALPGLIEIDRMLGYLARGRAPDQIAVASGTTVEVVTAVIDSATLVQEQSGYKEYGLNQPSLIELELADEAGAKPLPPLLEAMLRNLESSVAESAHRRDAMLSRWINSLHGDHDRHRWLFSTPGALLDFIAGLIQLEVPPRDVMLVFARRHFPEEALKFAGETPHALMPQSLQDKLSALGVVRSSWVADLPLAGRRQREVTVGVTLAERSAPASLYPAHIDRCLFLLATYRESVAALGSRSKQAPGPQSVAPGSPGKDQQSAG